MLLAKNILCNVPTALRTLNSSQISFKNQLFKNMRKGYVIPCMQKYQNIRYMSDNIDNKDLQKVYYGILTPQIRAVKVISFTTSLGGIIAQPILLQKLTQMEGGLPAIIGLCSVVGFFTFVTPFLLHLITKKYVTHLVYDSKSKEYIATVITFFCRQKKIKFSVEDVKVPDVPGMFTTFEVKGMSLFVDPTLFSDSTHYGKLMGYDKPIDFKLYGEVSTKK